jgi:opacity protein-like surface antigen
MKSKIALFTALALVAGSAVAADSGFYAGAGIGYGKININSDKIDNNFNSFAAGTGLEIRNSDVGQGATPYSLTVGYKFMKYFATEISYIDLGNADYTGKVYDTEFGENVGKIKGTWNAKGWPVSVLGIWPIDDAWSVFGRLGVFIGDVKLNAKATYNDGSLVCFDGSCAKGHESQSSTEFIGGVGTDFNFMDTWTARLEWQAMPSLGNDDVGDGNWNNFQFSILYNF